MNDTYNSIQYVVPENSEIIFTVLPGISKVSLKLLDGVADVYVRDKQTPLPFRQTIPLDFWECSEFPLRLNTKSGCNFLVRGNHYVYSAVQHELEKDTRLFRVSLNENSYSFNLKENIQLEIFPVRSIKHESFITIGIGEPEEPGVPEISGAPEISGFTLSPKTTYHLSPFFPVLLKSSDKKRYSIYVTGLARKIKLSILDENHHKCVKAMHEHIFLARCFFRKQFQNPTILVLGPKNVGKTSFCKLLVNKTLEKKMTPIYVDLNVKRNLGIPGALSLSEIESRIGHSLDYKYNIQRLLHYGLVDFHPGNVQFYDHLVRKMGEILSVHLNYNGKNFLAVIDTDGSQREYNTPIELLLKSFAVDIVFYMGDLRHYASLKNSILRNELSAFIPKPCNTEQLSDSYEARYHQYKIQKYFFGSAAEPSAGNVRTVALHDFAIYTISISPNIIITKDEKYSDYNIERIDINPSMLNRLFGVSAAKTVEFQGITEVKYYVYFTDIDMTAKMATVVVPESENFNGGILLMGSVLKLDDREIT